MWNDLGEKLNGVESWGSEHAKMKIKAKIVRNAPDWATPLLHATGFLKNGMMNGTVVPVVKTKVEADEFVKQVCVQNYREQQQKQQQKQQQQQEVLRDLMERRANLPDHIPPVKTAWD